ncbi:MAG: hypothetical protein RL701_6325 [Pseudomonadota bacterium]|jgi:DNA replication protein DnaC
MKGTVIAPELAQALRRLRLGQIIDALPGRLDLAACENMPIQDVLLMILTDEINRRDSTALGRRVDLSGLEPDMVFERWDSQTRATYDRRVLAELRTLRFLAARRNIAILGPVGVGKTFVACALGHLACRAEERVHFERADDMLRRLRQSRFDNSRDRLMLTLTTVDLLIIDDFGIEAMGKDESRDIYQLIVERHGRFSTIITSNRDTSEWLTVFDDTLLAQSAIDRFKNNAYDLVIEGESYRNRQKPCIDDVAQVPSVEMLAPRAIRRRTPSKRSR